jgi:2-haloacid dehalogenase/putative hydrolase of the HAD superfamily
MSLRPVEGVFLDFYGTVVGGDRLAVESVCQAVIDDYGLGTAAPELALDWGRRYFAAIQALNGDGFRLLTHIERDTLVDTLEPLVGRIDVSAYIERLDAYLVRPPIFDEVRAVLAEIDIPICIVSNADDRELREAIRHLGLNFREVISSEAAKSYKPASAIFELALARTGWSQERVVHVGDSLYSDVGGARAVGLQTAWVCRADRIGDIGDARPDVVWPDLRPLTGLTRA